VSIKISPSDNDNGGGDPIIVDGPNGGDLSSEFIYTPNVTFSGIDSIKYEVCDLFCVTVCENAMVYIDVKEERKIKIHNGFSPNGDGINETFNIDNIEYFPENKLVIFNRWGDEVYSAQPYKNEWDGTSKTKGVKVAGDKVVDGSYYYVLILKPNSDPYNGFIDLRR
jgi:gliding motility-associated-like protein